MQVHSEPSASSSATFASSTAGYDVGKPQAAPLTSQPLHQPPPPAYAPPSYQPTANAYGFNPSVGAAPAQYGAPSGYGFAPAGYGYPMGSVAPQTQLQNSQNVQVNVLQATASPPVIVAQAGPIVMSPPSYLGWSIFNFLCCFWPLGLAAIIYSVKVGSARNHEEAKSYSFTARNLNIAATTIAPILIIVVVGVVVGTAGAAARSSASYYSNSYYNSYSYYYYYATLMYYTYYGLYSFVSYGYTANGYSYSRITYAYSSVLTASKYVTDYYYSG